MTHYHSYERIFETKTAILYVCRVCKKKDIVKKDKNGRIDNTRFAKEHIADFAQPLGVTKKIFEQVYGKK